MGRRHRYKKKKIVKLFRRNEWIKSPQVRLIDTDEGLVGIVDTYIALAKAREKGLDLIEVSPKEDPPVAKIMDYGKFKYEQEKKRQKQKIKKVETKGIRLTLNMASHDLETKQKQIQKFFDNGHKAQIEMMLKGRQMAHIDRAFDQINSFINVLGNQITIIQKPIKKGKKITVIMQPK